MGDTKEPPDPPANQSNDVDIQNDWTGAMSLAAQRQGNQQQQKAYANVVYTEVDTGPYRVYFELRNNDGAQRINKFAVGSSLRKMEQYKHCITDMKQVGRNRILVFISSYLRANALVEEINKSTTSNFKAYVPLHLVSVTGIVDGVPADISEEEIMGDIASDVPIISVKRLNRFVDGQKIPANRISVRFRANMLPDRIRLFCCCARVRPFEQKLTACGKCLRFNHHEDRCKGNRRCKKCAGQHEAEEEFIQCKNKPKCAHCRAEDHTMLDENCPEKIRQKNIKMMMAKTAITFAEAKECFPLKTQNSYALLEDFSEFPVLGESYAATQHGESLRQQWQRTNQERERIKPAIKTYPDQPKKHNKQGVKRARKEGDQTTDSTNAMKATNERNRMLMEEPSNSTNGVALNNESRCNEKERWESLMREAHSTAEWTASQKTKSTMMTFYTDFLGHLGNQEDIKSKFKQCTLKYFNLANSVVEGTNASK